LNHIVIFDFDGVISDSLETVVENSRVICRRMGFDVEVSAQDVRTLPRVEFDELAVRLGIPADRSGEFMDAMLEMTSTNNAPIFPGMAEVLGSVRSRIVCVNTSNSAKAVEEFLARYGLRHLVESIYDKRFAPTKEATILAILDRYQAETREAVMVGDAASDVLAAKKSGVASGAVTWGYHSLELLESSFPDYLVRTPEELGNLLQASPWMSSPRT